MAILTAVSPSTKQEFLLKTYFANCTVVLNATLHLSRVFGTRTGIKIFASSHQYCYTVSQKSYKFESRLTILQSSCKRFQRKFDFFRANGLYSQFLHVSWTTSSKSYWAIPLSWYSTISLCIYIVNKIVPNTTSMFFIFTVHRASTVITFLFSVVKYLLCMPILKTATIVVSSRHLIGLCLKIKKNIWLIVYSVDIGSRLRYMNYVSTLYTWIHNVLHIYV